LFVRRARYVIAPFRDPSLRWVTEHIPQGAVPKQQADGSLVLELENIPPFKAEEYTVPESILKARIDFFYVLGPAFASPSYWASHGSRLSEAIEEFIGRSDRIRSIVKTLAEPADPAEAVVRKLYERAQKLRHLSFERPRSAAEQQKEGLSENKNAEDVLKRGYAQANEANLLFAAMVRAAGLQARIVLVTARDNDIFRPDLWDPDQLNAMVISVKIGDRECFFDPSTKFCPFGLLPWEETDAQGIRLDPSGVSGIHTSLPESLAAVTERRAELQLREDGTIEGKLIVDFFGQEALERRRMHNLEDHTGRREKMADEVKSWLPDGAIVEVVTIAQWDSTADPLRLECTVRVPQYAVVTGKRLLLSSCVFHSARENPFRHASRLHPIYFRYPHRERDEVTIELPEGYVVERVPAPFKLSDGPAGVEITRETDGNSLHVRRQYRMDGYVFDANQYGKLRAFYSGMRTADEERIVILAR
jgi:hypothetical protein